MKDLKCTARTLIDKAFKSIGVLGTGERSTDEEAFEALDLLNEIVAKFNNEDMFFNATKEYEIDADGTDTYLLDNISTDGIKDVFYNGANQYTKLNSLSKDQSVVMDRYNGSPTAYYFNFMFPTSTIEFFPRPANGKIKIITNGRFDLFDNLDTVIYMPDGWELCLRYNLAVRLCSEYGRQPTDLIISEASSTKALLKNTAQKNNPKAYGSDYPGCGGYRYDIRRG